jgi:hypothetical protein
VFALLRGYSRDHNLRLTAVAAAVVTGSLPAQLALNHARAKDNH